MLSPEGGGIRFGNYQLLRRLARGGMAEVFLAQQKGLEGFDRRVAIKRILPHLAGATDFIRMFLSEAKLAAQLTHPNIVHIYEFGKHDGDYFLAMEYVDGVHAGDIYEHGVSAEDKMPPALVARVGADAAIALHAAHETRGPDGKLMGLVHRDVSPANIMISFDGVVKLCDFGIAKAAALGEQLTTPGQVKGKYAYMSPEQTIGAPVDGRSDVFSLGIVMWELIAGRPIVSRGDPVGAMRAIRDGTLPRITKVAPGTPPALADAIDWALTNQRDERASALELAQALEAYIKASPELAMPLQLGAWIRARFARNAPSTEQGNHTQAGNHTEAGRDTPSPGRSTPTPVPTVASGLRSRAAWAEPDPFDGGETVSLDNDRTKAIDTNRRRTQDPDNTQPAERQTMALDDHFNNDDSTEAVTRFTSDELRAVSPESKVLDDALTPQDSPLLPSRRPQTGTKQPGTNPGPSSPRPVTKPTTPPFGPSSGSSPGARGMGSNPGTPPASTPGSRDRRPTERPATGLPPPRRGDARAPTPPRTIPPPIPGASLAGSPQPPVVAVKAAPEDVSRAPVALPTGFVSSLPPPPEKAPLRLETPPHGAPITLDANDWPHHRPGTPQPCASDAHSAIATILGPRRNYVIGIAGLAAISFVIAIGARSCADDPPPTPPAPAPAPALKSTK